MSARAALVLPRAPQAPGLARTWLAESFAAQLDARQRDTAKLLVTELVTNAVVHGRGSIELHAQLDQDRLLVDVIDEGPGFVSTDVRPIDGHGLWIVEAEASRWGVREGSADVWFELKRSDTGSDRNTSGAPPDAKRPEPERPTQVAPVASPTVARALRSHGNARGARAYVASQTGASAGARALGSYATSGATSAARRRPRARRLSPGAVLRPSRARAG